VYRHSCLFLTGSLPCPPSSHYSLIFVHISDPVGKIGCGVKAVELGTHPEHGNVCFMLRRTDGSLVDFSYRRCINNLASAGWSRQLPPIARLSVLAERMRRLNVTTGDRRQTPQPQAPTQSGTPPMPIRCDIVEGRPQPEYCVQPFPDAEADTDSAGTLCHPLSQLNCRSHPTQLCPVI
jgi:hypothetical protein